MKVEVKIRLSERARRLTLIEKHDLIPAEKVCEVDWASTSHEVRVALYEIATCVDAVQKIDLTTVRNGGQIYAFCAEKYPENKKEWEVLLQTYLAQRQVLSEEQRNLEKSEWIKQYGSVFLQSIFKHHYNAEQQYAFERAALEHPGFELVPQLELQVVDTPSPESHETALKHLGRVVWVHKPPPNASHGLFPIPCEAVWIEPYLEHHRLVKWMWTAVSGPQEQVLHAN